MSATYGWLRGYYCGGNPKQKRTVTACGPGRIWSKVGTHHTFVETEVYANGSGVVTVRREGRIIFQAALGPEDSAQADRVNVAGEAQIRLRVRKQRHDPGPYIRMADGASVATCRRCGQGIRVTAEKALVGSDDLQSSPCTGAPAETRP